MALFQAHRYSTTSRARDNLGTPPGPDLFVSLPANLERPYTKMVSLHHRRMCQHSITGPVMDKGRLRILRWSLSRRLTKLQSPTIICAQGHKRCQLRSIVQTSSETSDHCRSKSRHNIGIRITSLHPRQKLRSTGSKKCYRMADIKKIRIEQMLPTGLTLLKPYRRRGGQGVSPRRVLKQTMFDMIVGESQLIWIRMTLYLRRLESP